MFQIIIDPQSKWMEIHPMPCITSSMTVEKLKGIFATHGIPKVLVSDKGLSLVSAEFKHLMKKNGIKHVTMAPYQPSSNGRTEYAVCVKGGNQENGGG